jgi:hypothetical protein
MGWETTQRRGARTERGRRRGMSRWLNALNEQPNALNWSPVRMAGRPCFFTKGSRIHGASKHIYSATATTPPCREGSNTHKLSTWVVCTYCVPPRHVVGQSHPPPPKKCCYPNMRMQPTRDTAHMRRNARKTGPRQPVLVAQGPPVQCPQTV